jgi:hypothetical protein
LKSGEILGFKIDKTIFEFFKKFRNLKNTFVESDSRCNERKISFKYVTNFLNFKFSLFNPLTPFFETQPSQKFPSVREFSNKTRRNEKELLIFR